MLGKESSPKCVFNPALFFARYLQQKQEEKARIQHTRQVLDTQVWTLGLPGRPGESHSTPVPSEAPLATSRLPRTSSRMQMPALPSSKSG